jgi:hypothetical protein
MPLYMARFSYTPETWAKMIKNPEEPPGGGQGIHRIGWREAARFLVRFRRARWIQSLGGSGQRVDGSYGARHRLWRGPAFDPNDGLVDC